MYHSMNLSTPNNNIHARGASHTTDCSRAIMHDVKEWKCKCLGMSLVASVLLHNVISGGEPSVLLHNVISGGEPSVLLHNVISGGEPSVLLHNVISGGEPSVLLHNVISGGEPSVLLHNVISGGEPPALLHNVISGGESSVLLPNEATHFLSKEEKRSLIKDAGIVDIGPGEGLQVVGKIITQR